MPERLWADARLFRTRALEYAGRVNRAAARDGGELSPREIGVAFRAYQAGVADALKLLTGDFSREPLGDNYADRISELLAILESQFRT